MSDDELERLRTILAHVHDKPKRTSVRTIVRRVAKGFFTTPKKVIVERVEKDRPKSEENRSDVA
jgi:hypothetical protein